MALFKHSGATVSNSTYMGSIMCEYILYCVYSAALCKEISKYKITTKVLMDYGLK